MKESQICNHNESDLHISLIDTISNLLHDKLRAKKQFQSSLNHLTVCLKYHSADSEAKVQLKKNEQEENYS